MSHYRSLCVPGQYNTNIPSSLTVESQSFTCSRPVSWLVLFISTYLSLQSAAGSLSVPSLPFSSTCLFSDIYLSPPYQRAEYTISSQSTYSLSAPLLRPGNSKQVVEQCHRRQPRLLGQSHTTSAAMANAGPLPPFLAMRNPEPLSGLPCLLPSKCPFVGIARTPLPYGYRCRGQRQTGWYCEGSCHAYLKSY